MLLRIFAAAAFTLAAAAPFSASAQQQAPRVQAILNKLDASSARFTSAQADFEKGPLQLSDQGYGASRTAKVYFKRGVGQHSVWHGA